MNSECLRIGAESPDLFAAQPINLNETNDSVNANVGDDNETDFEASDQAASPQPGQRDAQPLEDDLAFIMVKVREMENRQREERDEHDSSY